MEDVWWKKKYQMTKTTVKNEGSYRPELRGLMSLRSGRLTTGVTVGNTTALDPGTVAGVEVGDAVDDDTALDSPIQPGALNKAHGRCLVEEEISNGENNG
jgi:hypothetical protein